MSDQPAVTPSAVAEPTPQYGLTSILAPRTVPDIETVVATATERRKLSAAQVAELRAQLQPGPKPTIISDAPTTDDRLGFRPMARTLAEIVLSDSTETPLAIAVDGKWGGGKTSILKMVESYGRLIGYNCIWLNAWALERAEHLIAEVTAGIQDELARSGRTPTGSFSEKVRVFLAGALASLVPGQLGGQSVRASVEASVRMAQTTADTGEIASIVRTQRHFQELVSILLERSPQVGGSEARLLVLIDDLDRALPDQITSMLKNLKQLLEMKGCVFLLAMDAELVAQGIEDFYRARFASGQAVSMRTNEGDVRLEVISGPSTIIPGFGRQYLEKLVQIILPVPTLSRAVALDCVRSFGFGEEAAEIVTWAPSAQISNPRRLKRYLNTLSVNLQLLMACALPAEFDNAYALRALALRGDWSEIYQRLVKMENPLNEVMTWPEAEENSAETQSKFTAYLAQFHPETGALARFESFLGGSNLFLT